MRMRAAESRTHVAVAVLLVVATFTLAKSSPASGDSSGKEKADHDFQAPDTPTPFLPMGTDFIRRIRWSPDGQRVAIGDFGTLTVWDPETRLPLAEVSGELIDWFGDRVIGV